MKIKDISKFRTYWKEKEGFQGFDENFIGTNHRGVNGFYRIVNGTVHDIKADLTPKLQNAQDEQAIYEFLQNAADSYSSNCAVIYDEDYFMVINNGLPFTVKDVEAILNSFQGTKADKSQKQNCDKISLYREARLSRRGRNVKNGPRPETVPEAPRGRCGRWTCGGHTQSCTGQARLSGHRYSRASAH